MTFFAKRNDRRPEVVDVQVNYGPITIRVEEHPGHLRSFWHDLGALLNEIEGALRLSVFVNGQVVEVEAHPSHALSSVMPSALEQTGNRHEALDNWEMRNESGTLLRTDRQISAYGFTDGSRLYLNPKPGIGG